MRMDLGEIALDLDALSEETKHIVPNCARGFAGFHIFDAIEIIDQG